MQVDPENAELQSLKAELEEFISLTEASIAELKPATPTSSVSQPHAKEKWQKESHPAYQSSHRKTTESAPPEEAPTPISFSVNDNVLARWTSGDGAWYPARITSITGSSSNPVYIVSFKSYATTETLSARDIKPTSNGADSRKRKADGTSGTSSSQALPQNAGIISAAADINPTLANQARNEPSKVNDGPSRPNKVPRKVKANKELEAGKNKWQDFTSKSKFGKSGKKESMFRTPDGVNARGMQSCYRFYYYSLVFFILTS